MTAIEMPAATDPRGDELEAQLPRLQAIGSFTGKVPALPARSGVERQDR
jgi:hypothetical protein